MIHVRERNLISQLPEMVLKNGPGALSGSVAIIAPADVVMQSKIGQQKCNYYNKLIFATRMLPPTVCILRGVGVILLLLWLLSSSALFLLSHCCRELYCCKQLDL